MKKILLSLLVASSLMMAEGAFSLGQKHFSFGISQDGDYTVIGANMHYYVIDNLSLGVGATTWVGDKPSVNRLTVPITYYMPLESSIRPYAGLFGSYTFMGDDGDKKYDDYSSFGGRAGVVLDVSDAMYTYAGWVQVKHNGDNSIDSTEGYPEFGFGMSF